MRETGAIGEEGKHRRDDLPGLQGVRDGELAEQRGVRLLQLFDLASARSGVEIVVEHDVLDRLERAQQRIFRFVQPFCRLHGRRLFISGNVETNVFWSEMHGGLDGRDAVVESVGENESLIAFLQRVLHLRQH